MTIAIKLDKHFKYWQRTTIQLKANALRNKSFQQQNITSDFLNLCDLCSLTGFVFCYSGIF